MTGPFTEEKIVVVIPVTLRLTYFTVFPSYGSNRVDSRYRLNGIISDLSGTSRTVGCLVV